MPEGYDYVALQPILYNGVRAFNTGDPVPNSHVKDHNLGDDQVAKADSPKAKQATGAAEEPTSGGTSAKA